jgi:adenylate cyclase
MIPSDDELAALGLYDPGAAGAAERLELLHLAFEYGATVDEVHQAIDEDRLHAVAALRAIEGGRERLTFEEAVRRADVDPERAARIWRVLGLPDPEPGSLSCTERDVDLLRVLSAKNGVISEENALQIARATGAAMAKLADAEVAMVRAINEAPLRSAGGSNVDVAHELLYAAREVLPGMLVVIDAAHRHHLVAAGRRYALWGVRPTERSTTDIVVGFTDMVGYTTLGQELDSTDLDALLRRFEDRALEATRRPLARLVKLIGDEAMFVARDPTDALEIVHEIWSAPDLPPMRAGLAAGTVIVREGDVFGPVVNLAARLEGLAEPGQVLLDAVAAARLVGGRARSLGTRSVPGFDGTVEIFTV